MASVRRKNPSRANAKGLDVLRPDLTTTKADVFALLLDVLWTDDHTDEAISLHKLELIYLQYPNDAPAISATSRLC